MIGLPHHQIRLNHIPDCPLRPISVMGLGPLSIETIGPFHMIGGPRTIGVGKKLNRPEELLGPKMFHRLTDRWHRCLLAIPGRSIRQDERL